MVNTWLPGGVFFSFGSTITQSVVSVADSRGVFVLASTFVIPDAVSGIGITFDQIFPPFTITNPPKVSYSSTSDMVFVVKDADDWLWAAPAPKQLTLKERGWAWDKFVLHSYQDNVGQAPLLPATGVIKVFQFSGAEGVHASPDNPNTVIPQTINIQYITAVTPESASSGNIRKFVITDKDQSEHLLKVGDVVLIDGARVPIKYLGALPFGIQQNGPRNRLSTQPYKGPLVAGYQSGVPWVLLENNDKLANMLQFMEDSQVEFSTRTPGIVGPWMHIYLPALWDCEQNGPIDTWVWDGPDGNPAWDGWQYRTIDSMGRAWAECYNKLGISIENKEALSRICSKFLDWLHEWLINNPDSMGVPDDWRPIGWTQGIPLTPNRGLLPKFFKTSSHDCCLAMKGAIFSGVAGYDLVKTKYIVHRCIVALASKQVKNYLTEPAMNGAFTGNPDGYEVYGFEQGEILEALALAKQHPQFLIK